MCVWGCGGDGFCTSHTWHCLGPMLMATTSSASFFSFSRMASCSMHAAQGRQGTAELSPTALVHTSSYCCRKTGSGFASTAMALRLRTLH